jgi:hypothetical protein
MLTPFWRKKKTSEKLHSLSWEMKAENSNQKLAISGQCTATLHQGFLFLYGGYTNSGFNGVCKSETLLCDLENFLESVHLNDKWNPPKFVNTFIKPEELPKLASSSICSHPFKNIVYIFGGSGEIWGKSNSNDFTIIDFDKKTIQKIENNQTPPASYGSTLNFYNNKLYLFGGTNGTFFFNQVYEYDLEKQNWKLLQVNGAVPKTRYKHNSFIYQDHLYIFNGGQYDPLEGQIKLNRLNLKTLVWEIIDVFGEIPPNMIASASAHDTIGNKVWIFGGRLSLNINEKKSNNLYMLDLETFHFTKYQMEDNNYKIKDSKVVENTTLEGREFHSCSYYNGKLICTGGSTGKIRLNHVLVLYLPI